MTTGVRVRFANGVLILRIEDTDIERSSGEMTQGILDAMTWLGLDWDEGPEYQSLRTPLYKTAVGRLPEGGWAYCCVCAAVEHNAECRER